MTHPKFRYRTAATIVILAALPALAVLLMGAVSGEHPKPTFNANGELNRPTGYREWVYVGTPLTPNDLNPPEANFPEFHNVYIHPADFDHYKRSGEFPDGTILVKELVTVGATSATSGKGYFMGEFRGLEATIKDSKRFADEPGYWAYFSFGHSYPLADSAAPFPTAVCNACHDASAKDDFVFTQYYPILRAAKGGEKSGITMNSQSEEFQSIAASMMNARGAAFDPSADTPRRVDSVVPVDMAQLFPYLRDGRYKQLQAQESGLHASAGPHTKYGLPVRVFLGPKLDASLAAGNQVHPVGSSAVKEMYDGDGNLQGWAVMVKTQAESAGGKGWFWMEVTSTTDPSDPVAIGNGVPLCQGCHFGGNDFVLTGYPLR